MLVTEVEMLLSNADPVQTRKMLEWMNRRDEKFLFDPKQRSDYGLVGTDIASWDPRMITVHSRCRTGPFIDFRFTLHTYDYPHHLADILRASQWKVKARFRKAWIVNSNHHDSVSWYPWVHVCDADFHCVWCPLKDRKRQEGR